MLPGALVLMWCIMTFTPWCKALFKVHMQAPCYKLYALSPPAVAAPPSKPAMVRVNTGGAAIALETYDLPLTSVGAFMTKVGFPP